MVPSLWKSHLMSSAGSREQWRIQPRNLKKNGSARDYISGVHFQKCSKISIFFHIKYQYNFFNFKGGRLKGLLNTPLHAMTAKQRTRVCGPVNQANGLATNAVIGFPQILPQKSPPFTSQAQERHGAGGRASPPKKNPEKIFFGQLLCKNRAFFGQKFGNFVNFSGKYNKYLLTLHLHPPSPFIITQPESRQPTNFTVPRRVEG